MKTSPELEKMADEAAKKYFQSKEVQKRLVRAKTAHRIRDKTYEVGA